MIDKYGFALKELDSLRANAELTLCTLLYILTYFQQLYKGISLWSSKVETDQRGITLMQLACQNMYCNICQPRIPVFMQKFARNMLICIVVCKALIQYFQHYHVVTSLYQLMCNILYVVIEFEDRHFSFSYFQYNAVVF